MQVYFSAYGIRGIRRALLVGCLGAAMITTGKTVIKLRKFSQELETAFDQKECFIVKPFDEDSDKASEEEILYCPVTQVPTDIYNEKTI